MNMATTVPRASPATSSGFALATSARRNDVATKNVDRMVLGLPYAAKVVIVAGRGGAGEPRQKMRRLAREIGPKPDADAQRWLRRQPQLDDVRGALLP